MVNYFINFLKNCKQNRLGTLNNTFSYSNPKILTTMSESIVYYCKQCVTEIFGAGCREKMSCRMESNSKCYECGEMLPKRSLIFKEVIPAPVKIIQPKIDISNLPDDLLQKFNGFKQIDAMDIETFTYVKILVKGILPICLDYFEGTLDEKDSDNMQAFLRIVNSNGPYHRQINDINVVCFVSDEFGKIND
jgi:hypothetical protein